jgi:hypothetical protein
MLKREEKKRMKLKIVMQKKKKLVKQKLLQ